MITGRVHESSERSSHNLLQHEGWRGSNDCHDAALDDSLYYYYFLFSNKGVDFLFFIIIIFFRCLDFIFASSFYDDVL